MAQRNTEHGVKNVERRLTAVEQILPALATKTDLESALAPLATRADLEAAVALLATKAELQAAVAPLATREEGRAEIQASIAPLATKAEVRAEGVETRRHFDVVAERMHADVRMLAEGIVATQARCDARHLDVTGTLTQHDLRLTRLEVPRSKRR
jgi:hypothetical protein